MRRRYGFWAPSLRPDELMHYGRLGMKWYQHIFGPVQAGAKYAKGENKELTPDKRLSKYQRADGSLTRMGKKHKDAAYKYFDEEYVHDKQLADNYHKAYERLKNSKAKVLVEEDKSGMLLCDSLSDLGTSYCIYNNRASEYKAYRDAIASNEFQVGRDYYMKKPKTSVRPFVALTDYKEGNRVFNRIWKTYSDKWNEDFRKIDDEVKKHGDKYYILNYSKINNSTVREQARDEYERRTRKKWPYGD